MGSYSTSISSTSAVDKRQVVSENGVGQSIDGSNNLSNAGTYLNNASISSNTLDGGAIGAAFDFANKSLSSVLALAVERDKVSAAAASAVTDSALQGIAAIGQTAAETATESKIKENKYLIAGAVILALVWYKWGK